MSNTESNADDIVTNTMQSDTPTLTLEIPLDESNAARVQQLDGDDVDIEEIIANQLMPAVDDTIHKIWKDARYSQ